VLWSHEEIDMARLRPFLLLVAAGCATAAPAWQYRAEGSSGDRAAPIHLEPLASGQAEYRIESAVSTGRDASVVRAVRAVGEAPVRVDLGRVRLRAGSVEVPILRVCLLDPTPRCSDGGAARGQVQMVARGDAVRVRVDFGPVDPRAPGSGEPDPALAGAAPRARLTLLEEGIYVAGHAVPVSVVLERIPRR
jgi:hypothetical protein